MKKITSISALSVAMLAMTGCVGTKQLSNDITREGQVSQENIVWPALDKAWQKQGQFPNRENLSKIKAGIDKDELYQLIGRPHFSERQKAREWDYIMKFYQADDSVKICQYKVIFDKDYKGQEFYWLPADCAQYATMPEATVVYQQAPVQPPVVIQQPAQPIISEKISLSADALFRFDKWKLEDMLPQGRVELDNLASKLRAYQSQGYSQMIITGHTDYLGEDMYNMNLSQLRAQTVRAYLISRGVDGTVLIANGAGETQPVKQCDNRLARNELINCLQPNRRVEVSVSVFTQKPATDDFR